MLGVRLAVTGGTDALRQVGSAFLQLKLVLDKGGKPETVYMGTRAPRRGVWRRFASGAVLTWGRVAIGGCPPRCARAELSLQQFYQFLRDMEQAKSSLDYFS